MKGGRFAIVVVGLLLAVLVVASLARTTTPRPFDPRSTEPDGTKAMVLLMQEWGAQVEIGGVIPSASDAHLLVLVDRLTRTQREDALRWVESGGQLVVADPSSSLPPGQHDGDPSELFGTVDRGTCTLGGIEQLRTLQVGAGVGLPLDPQDTSCFGDGTHAFVRATRHGRGEVVALGGQDVLTNALLDKADNAALAVDLTGGPGGQVVVLEPRLAGDGDKTLLDLVSPRVWQALAQLALAFVVLAWWRGRRLGKPVVEQAPVEIAGSELVLARGDLLRRAHQPARAAQALRADLHRELCRALSLPAATPVDVLDGACAARARTDPGEVQAILAGPPVQDEQGLAVLSRRVDAVRQRVSQVATAPDRTIPVP